MVLVYKCKECWVEKEYSNFYSHPKTTEKIMHRCKICVRGWRASEHELSLSRLRDRERYRTDPKRRKELYEAQRRAYKTKWYGSARCKAHKIIKNKQLRPKICSVCKKIYDWTYLTRIIFHHPDYNYPLIWVFCCESCHSKFHRNKIDPKEYLVNLNQ